MEKHLKKIQQELADQQAKIYDVRELEEWEEGHLSQAVFLPLSELYKEKNFEKLDKEKKIYLYCRSGNRTLQAEEVLLQKGFKNVIPLEEGYDYLVEEGFPVEQCK